MGIYLNPGDEKFQMAKESKIYIDKTGMLVYLNQMISTELRYICVSRPRRFGKSMAANMVSAYYDRTVDARADFAGLQIVRDKSFAKYCSRYDVLALNMQEFLSRSQDMQALLEHLKKSGHISIIELIRGVSPDFAVVAQKAAEKQVIDATDEVFNKNRGITLDDMAQRYDMQNNIIADDIALLPCIVILCATYKL